MWIYNQISRLFMGEQSGDIPDGCDVTDIAPPAYRAGYIRGFGFDGQWIEHAIPAVDAVDGRLALHHAGLLDQAEAVVEQAGAETRIWYAKALHWERLNPFVVQMGAALDLTPEQIDAMFLSA